MIVHVTKKKTQTVASFEEASRVVRAHWSNRGGNAFYGDRLAGIIENERGPVAHVSYNGRVWDGVARYSLGGALLFDPAPETV